MILITLKDILQYVGDSTRPLKEGLLIVESSHIVRCGLVADSSDYDFHVFALVLQNSNLKGKPHEIHIKFRGREVDATCTCHAGSPKCKHIVGVLLCIENTDTEDLDKISCTDVVQSWGVLSERALNSYDFCPLKDMKCHVRPFKLKYELPPDPTALSCNLAENVVRNLKSIFPNSSLAKADILRTDVLDLAVTNSVPCTDERIPELLPRPYIEEFIRQNLDGCDWMTNLLLCSLEEQQYFYNNVAFEASTFVNLAEETYRQSSTSWLKARMYRITGYTCYNLYTYQRNPRTAAQWRTKIGGAVRPSFSGNSATAFGKKHESVALEKFILDKPGRLYSSGLLVNEGVPYLGFSPDAFYIHEVDNKEVIQLVEVKCPERGMTMNTEAMIEVLHYIVKNPNGELKLREKHPYYGQIQLGLFLTQLPSCHFLVYNKVDDAIVNILVERNETFGRDLFTALTNVYFKYYLPFLNMSKI